MQLVEFLEASGWSKAELSRKIGVSKQAIGMIFLPRRSKTTDVAICLAHGWRVWEFNKMIADLVGKYPVSDKFWKQVKSDSDIRK